MASTREERLQMRQRGAGTHKTKEIDFGFSFGGAAIGAPDPAALPLFPEPKQSSQTATAPPAATPPLKDSQADGRIRRTPRSVRNELPERPSPYDIPVDDGLPQRSNKRRKLSPPSRISITPSHSQLAAAGNRFSTTAQNGDTQASSSQSTEAPVNEILVPATQPETSTDGNARKEKKRDTNGAGSDPVAASESPQNATIPERPRASRVPLLEKRPDFDHGPSPKSAQQRRRKSRSPQRDEARPARRRPSRQSSSPTAQRDNQTSTKDVQRRGDPNTLEAIQSPVADASASAGRPETESPRPITAVAENDNQIDQRPSSGDETWSKPKRGGPRNAKGKSSQSARDATLQNESEQTQEDETRDEPANTASQASSKQKRGRKRRSPAQTTPDPNAEEASTEGEAGPATAESKPQFKSKRPRRESSPVGKKATAEAEARPEKPAVSSAAAGESSAAATRRGRKPSKKRVAEPQPEVVDPEPEETSQEPEPEVDALPETQAGPSRARRDRTNKGKGKNKRAAEPEEAPSEEQPDTEATQEPRRKTREPRGDTVPVTVHRLANASALGAINVSAEGFGNEDEDSPDGLLSRLNTNIPSRGGVNPADVLSQICRETLEKTLEKLKTGIENETNTQKRAEWTRKRKAVEAFGLELDNRLLDLSEILDSNFVLGMQLRKAKRDMMDLRSHLYKVRKERESIAIQMDAVRAKHMEEENAKTARNTINNSLHSLELALDRSQHRAEPSTEAYPADLEFMLRTVADDVSCRAPGAQGGLLNQIRALNHQLEVTARRLERS